ncbi:MAG: DMT family transporter [Deltaproteobacteria bacterium]|nr:DMT family transporter [Deltaproteobacteria bacterium]
MNRIRGKLCISLAFFLAGSSVVAAGYVADTLGPFTITGISLVFAGFTAFVLSNKKMLASFRTITAQKWKNLVWQSLIGVFLFRVLLTFGLQRTSAAEAGILIGTSPAITAVLTRLLLREPLSGHKIAGIGATLAGMAVLQGFPFTLGAFSMSHLLGNLLVLGSAACESAFVLIARAMAFKEDRQAPPLDPIVHSGYVSLISLLACLPLMLWENQLGSLPALSTGGWLSLAWYGGMVTVIAFACMFYGARTCDGYTLAAFSGLIPVTALLLSAAILGETVTARHCIGCACIVIAILLMNRR